MQKLLLASIALFLGFMACTTEDTPPNTNEGAPNTPLSSATEATDSEGNTYRVGYNQASGNNQNPFVVKENAAGEQVWRITHETTGVDGRATLIAVDSRNRPWVVFSLDGGSNSGDYLTKKEVEGQAFSGVFQSSYGNGGGPKVSVLARLNPSSGKIEKGSFVTARLTSGNTNTLNIKKLGFKDSAPAFEVSSAAWPPGAGRSYSRFPDITDADRVDGAFKVYYEMNEDLSAITKAELLK